MRIKHVILQGNSISLNMWIRKNITQYVVRAAWFLATSYTKIIAMEY